MQLPTVIWTAGSRVPERERSCNRTEESKPYRSRGYRSYRSVRGRKKAVAVEVNAETDFVAKNEKFQAYVAEVAAQALNTTAADIDAFLAEPWALDTTKTVKEALAAQIAVIGENMNIRRFKQVEEQNGFVASYIHAGGKIGVLVDVETDVVNDEIKEMAKNIAMQIAALKPVYTNDAKVKRRAHRA